MNFLKEYNRIYKKLHKHRLRVIKRSDMLQRILKQADLYPELKVIYQKQFDAIIIYEDALDEEMRLIAMRIEKHKNDKRK